jgi:hypothetical protein
MNLQTFAEQYGVKLEHDGCRHLIAAGWQYGAERSHIFDGFADGRLGVCLMYETAREWNAARLKLVAAGFALKQNAATEGTLTFNPENDSQSRLALETCCVARGAVLEAA